MSPNDQSAKPATETVDGLRKSEQLASELGFKASSTQNTVQEQAHSLEFRLNAREVIRAAVSEFNGRENIDIRRWYRAENGEIRPTPKGLVSVIRHPPSLGDLITDALSQARADELLPRDDRGCR
jgi:hypothetical protein